MVDFLRAKNKVGKCSKKNYEWLPHLPAHSPPGGRGNRVWRVRGSEAGAHVLPEPAAAPAAAAATATAATTGTIRTAGRAAAGTAAGGGAPAPGSAGPDAAQLHSTPAAAAAAATGATAAATPGPALRQPGLDVLPGSGQQQLDSAESIRPGM